MRIATTVWTAALALGIYGLLPGAPAQAALPLPQGRACVAEDMKGLFKLHRVLEDPQGTALQQFNTAPHQYVFFRENQTFAQVAGSRIYTEPAPLDADLRQAFKQDVRQYVLDEKGTLYFYRGTEATDASYCVIAQGAEELYGKGDLVLVQIKPASGSAPKSEVIKIYSAMSFDKPKAAPVKQGTKKAQNTQNVKERDAAQRRAAQRKIQNRKAKGAKDMKRRQNQQKRRINAN